VQILANYNHRDNKWYSVSKAIAETIDVMLWQQHHTGDTEQLL